MTFNNGRTYFLGQGGTKDLTVRVSIRRVPPNNDDTNDHLLAETKTKTITWQEKILGPRERIAVAMTDRKLHQETSDTEHLGGNDENLLLYTYVDSDFYCPSLKDRCSTSIRTSEYLEKAVNKLPIHNLHTTSTLPNASMLVHDRISRDDPFEIMYIMVATDVDYEELRKLSQITETIQSLDNLAPQKTTQEKVLCVLKYYKSGILEVSPGFSEYERNHSEKSDCMFLSSPELLSRSKSINISTFYFKTRQGVHYQYTLNWPEYIKDVRILEEKDIVQVDEDFQKIAVHRKEIIMKLRKISPVIENWTREEDIILLELVSASKFYIRPSPNLGSSNASLFVRYEIILPSDWTPLCETRPEERIGVLRGTTKKVRSLDVGSLLFGTDTVSLIFFFVAFKLSIFLMDIPMIGITLVVAVIVLIMEENVSGNYCQYNKEGFCDVSFFLGHLVELNKVFHSNTTKKPALFDLRSTTRPKIFIQVCASRGNGIESALGYALMEIPTFNSGTHDIELSTCKPIPKEFFSRQLSNLRDDHFGTSKDSFVSMRDYFLRRSGDTKSEFVTETSGVVRLRFITISRPQVERHDPGEIDNQKPVLVETIDEVLSRVRRNRRERQICSNFPLIPESREMSEEKEDMDFLERSRTKHVLSKIRARQATRAKELGNHNHGKVS